VGAAAAFRAGAAVAVAAAEAASAEWPGTSGQVRTSHLVPVAGPWHAEHMTDTHWTMRCVPCVVVR
jgi:hypothetical protein